MERQIISKQIEPKKTRTNDGQRKNKRNCK